MAGARKDQIAQEKRLFEAFAGQHPFFAGTPIRSWCQPKADPPDIVCRSMDGRVVGVELKTWVNEEGIRDSKPRHDFAESFLRVLVPQPANTTTHIKSVACVLKVKMPQTSHAQREEDQISFRSELYEAIERVDANWKQLERSGPRGYYLKDLSGTPALRKYLDYIVFRPKAGPCPRGMEWIYCLPTVHLLSDAWMQNKLRKVIEGAIQKYESQTDPKLRDLHEFHLLVHYSADALIYNPPADTAGYAFDDYADTARKWLDSRNSKPFNRIYMFIEYTGAVYELFHSGRSDSHDDDGE
jgi:hypothetical protein